MSDIITVVIDEDELWPDYTVHSTVRPGSYEDRFLPRYEITRELMEQYQKAQNQFYNVRAQLREAMEQGRVAP